MPQVVVLTPAFPHSIELSMNRTIFFFCLLPLVTADCVPVNAVQSKPVVVALAN